MKIDAVKWVGVLMIILALMAGSAWTAWAWQANAYGQQLATKETAHQTERTHLANANSAQILAEQDKRLALEQWLAASDKSHYRALTDEKTKQARLRDRLATADLRLVVTQCKPPPAQAAWFMAPIEPDLTQRMLNELSESPATATKD